MPRHRIPAASRPRSFVSCSGYPRHSGSRRQSSTSYCRHEGSNESAAQPARIGAASGSLRRVGWQGPVRHAAGRWRTHARSLQRSSGKGARHLSCLAHLRCLSARGLLATKGLARESEQPGHRSFRRLVRPIRRRGAPCPCGRRPHAGFACPALLGPRPRRRRLVQDPGDGWSNPGARNRSLGRLAALRSPVPVDGRRPTGASLVGAPVARTAVRTETRSCTLRGEGCGPTGASALSGF